VLPPEKQEALLRRDLNTFATRHDARARARLGRLRKALRARRKVRLVYRDREGAATTRIVRPLSLEAWGHAWTLTAWCELREDFRAFRLDRMEEAAATDATFRPEPGCTLADFHARLEQEGWHVATA
jgi:predicted DNA-binding transcriptional regulator YafY